jgi:hypothetical protein
MSNTEFTKTSEGEDHIKGRGCSSLCHDGEPCSITSTGRCDTITATGNKINEISRHLDDAMAKAEKMKTAIKDMEDMLIRCEGWFSTIAEGRKMQLECQRVIALHNGKNYSD